MRNIITLLTLAALALLPVAALAVEETGASGGGGFGVSNLILLLGLGAVVAVGLAFGVRRSDD